MLDVAHPSVSKGATLAEWAALRGYHRDETMAIGDNHNDREMLEFAGLPVVMANCVDELKTTGWRETLSNDEAGVAAAIEAYALGGADEPLRRILSSTRSVACGLALALVCIVSPAARADYAVMATASACTSPATRRSARPCGCTSRAERWTCLWNKWLRFEPEEIFTPVSVQAKAGPLAVPYSDLIRQSAGKYGLEPHLLAGVMRAESNFNPRAVSVKNAQGLMQLLPSTANHLAVRNTFDPAQNIEAGARYLKQLLDRFGGNIALALAAYNAGPERVKQYNGVPPYRETQNYVKRITTHLAADTSRSDARGIADAFRFD